MKVDKRKFLYASSISTAKAITQNKNIKSKNQSFNRRPEDQIILIDNPPRGHNQLSSWRGSIDLQIFWNKYHDSSKVLNTDQGISKYLYELFYARAEILGSSEYLGSKSNITSASRKYFESIHIDDFESELPAVMNVWLKSLFGFSNSKKTSIFVKKFQNSYLSKKTEKNIANKFINSIHDQVSFEASAINFLELLGFIKYEEKVNDQNEDATIPIEESDDQIDDKESESKDKDNEDIQDLKDFKFEFEDQQDEVQTAEQSIQEEIDLVEMSSSLNTTGVNIEQEYQVYTNEFDEIVNARELSNQEETIRLRAQLDNLIKPHITTIGKLANRLQRLLQAKMNTSWNYDLEEGILDSARLHRVITNPASHLSFKQETDHKFKDTLITLLIDNSGSMRGRSINIAAVCADIIGATLERCQIKTEILGFTTKNWKGGDSKQKWSFNGSRANPGRLNDLRHIIYKSADENWRRSRKSLGIMLKEGLLKENIDGEALLWSFKRSIQRPEKRKILIVISDGAPVDDSTLSANNDLYLDNHLREIINQIENYESVELSAIGIGHDVTKYYKNAISIIRAEELGEILLDKLINLFK
jgi:cobaltochelatase CobT